MKNLRSLYKVVTVSLVSKDFLCKAIWEIQIKVQLGKMKLSLPLQDLLESQEQANNLEILPITKEHIFALDNLPFHHKDPFDRLLIAQGIIENIPIVSADSKLSAYSVTVFW